jgi:hypothetical protein
VKSAAVSDRFAAAFYLLLLGACLAVLPIILDLMAPSFTWTIQPQNLASWGDNAWEQEIGRIPWPFVVDGDHGGVTGPPSSLTENGVPLGPPHSGHDDIRRMGGGRYSLWDRSLVFSTNDGTDPRDNGRSYVVTGRTRIGGLAVLWSILGAASAGCLALILRSWPPAATPAGSHGGVNALWRRRGDILIAALPPSLVAIILMLFVPPTLYAFDSASNIAINLDTVPLYGPVYMGLLRLIKYTVHDGRDQITALQAIQHTVTVIGITILSTSYSDKLTIILSSAFATIGGCFCLFSHGISVDALVVGESSALLGIFFRIVRQGPSRVRLILYSVILALLALTRYHFVIFGLALPIHAALGLIGARSEWRLRVRHFISASANAAAGFLIMALALWTVCLALGTHPTLYSGRQGSHRMAEAARLLPADQRSQWIERLAMRTSDPQVQLAIRIMASGPIDWFTSWKTLQRNPALWGRNIDALEDRAFQVFAFALDDPVVRTQWLHQYAQFFGPDDGFWYGEVALSAGAAGILIEPQSRAAYPWLKEAALPADAERWTELDTRAKPWLAPLSRYMALEVPLLATLILSVLALLLPGYEKNGASASLTLLLVMVISFTGITFSNIIQLRHLLPETILVYAAFGNIIAVFLESPPRSRRVTAGPT